MRRILLSLTLVAFATVSLSTSAPTASAQARGRALTLEDYYSFKSVGAPRVSPAGDWVAYTVSTPVEETNQSVTESWIVRADGSAEPVRVHRDGENVSNPRWKSDGRLLFSQQDAVWSIDPAQPTGTAVRETEDGSEGLASPDGRWLARTQDMPRPARPEPQLSEFERRHEERFRGDAFDWYPFRRDRQDFPLPDPRQQPLSEIVLDSADGNGTSRQLTRLGLRPGGLRWKPDGSALLFTADEAVLDELAYGRSDLFVVTVDGELTRLTDDGYTYSGVNYSPDGRWISYVRAFGSDMIIDRKLRHGGPRDLYIRPADGGEAINLTADFDLDARTPMWAPDSGHIYFTTGIGGATHLFRVSPSGGPVEQVTTGERRIQGLDINPSFQRMAYIPLMSMSTPFPSPPTPPLRYCGS